ncbi:MAG: hypothetical protein AAGD22_09170 [Verrucomicrobiota bacterium]
MAEAETKVATRRGRSLGSRLRGLFLWVVSMILLTLLLVGGVLFVAYEWRVRIVNAALKEIAAPFRVEVAGIDFLGKGRLMIRDLRAGLPDDEVDRIRVPIVELTYRRTGRLQWAVETLRVRQPEVFIDDAVLGAMAEQEGGVLRESDGQGGQVLVGWGTGVRLDLGRVLIQEGRFEMQVSGVPTMSGELDFESARLYWESGHVEMEEEHRFVLRDFEMDDGEELTVRLPEMECIVAISGTIAAGGEVRVLRLVSPEVLMSQAAWVRLRERVPNWDGVGGDGEREGRWRVGTVAIEGAVVATRGNDGVEDWTWPEVSMEIEVEGGGFEWAEGKLVFEGLLQRVAIRDLNVVAGEAGEEEALLNVGSVDFIADMGALLGEGRLEKLHFDQVSLDVSHARANRLESVIERYFGALDAADPGGMGEQRVWQVVDLAIREGRVDVDGAGWGDYLPRVEGSFELGMKPEEGNSAYRLAFEDIRVSAAGEGGERAGLVDGAAMTIDFDPQRVQLEKAIDFVAVDGVRFAVGPTLTKVVDAVQGVLASEEQEEADVVSEGAGISGVTADEERWRIDELTLTRSEVLVEDLIPGLPLVSFQVQTDRPLENIFLDGQPSESEEVRQRLELIGLRVVSPLNPLLTVADLRTIFVEFTLNGLLNQEIEVVEVLNPEVYVGQHLFWYVDHYRSLFKGEPETEDERAEGAVAVQIDGPGQVAIPGWNINSFGVYNGKLVFAPKGYPVGENPFPFSVTSRLVDGEVDLELTIPKGDYVYPTLQLELVGLTGSVNFNLPAKTVDNNLVETLSVEKLRFRKWEANNVFVTMTYDETGVYMQFGGDAYAGYVNGAANVYIGEPYQWDGWVSGVDVDLKAFTGAFQPGWISMEGIASGEFVVEGVEMIPGKATAEFTMDTPGKLHIERMDTWLEDIPEDWSNLEKSIARISLEDFRDYSFDTGYGDLDAVGWEGKLELFLDGPSGKRDFRVFFHDERGIAKQRVEALRLAVE